MVDKVSKQVPHLELCDPPVIPHKTCSFLGALMANRNVHPLCLHYDMVRKLVPHEARKVSSLRRTSLTLAAEFGMTTTYDDLMSSDCTSCRVTQDKSAYWCVLT